MYKPVPADVAHQVAEAFDKNVVVILAWDYEFGMLHSTSFGREAADKLAAARIAERLVAVCGADQFTTFKFEDFREMSAAEWTLERDLLLKRIAELEQREVQR